MLQTLDQMVASKADTMSRRTWTQIDHYFENRAEHGFSASSVTKIKTAVNGLLKSKGVSPENAPLDLDWFDRMFPTDGWDPTTMPFGEKTYQDYRYRARPLIEEMLGLAEEKKWVRSLVDEWDDAAAEFELLDAIAGRNYKKKMIPFRSTLTQAARRTGLQPGDLDQQALLNLHDKAKKSERLSLRTASRMIADGQKVSPEVAQRFPHPIQPIEANNAFRYNVPEHFSLEIEDFVEYAARLRYIRAKKTYEYVKDGTRSGMRTTMRAVVDGFIATGHLDPQANSFRSALNDEEALADLLGHIVDRIGDDGISMRHATTLVSRLPSILDRNGIESATLRDLIKEVPELGHHSQKAGMPEKTKRLCRKIIEDRKFRNNFLLAHATTRAIAQDTIDAAKQQGRSLSRTELGHVISHGTVAFFDAFEIGGAPVRVENVLEMPFGCEKAWMQSGANDISVTIPGNFVKNGKEIRFEMKPGRHRFAETVQWYIDHIRPLILTDPDTGEIASSPWLVPMLSDPTRPCPYETFHGWFTRIMRDAVGIPCTPHNYRHGQASLLYHRYPERLGWIAVRLGDTEDTVLRYYAWIHAQKAMAEGQRLISDIIDD